MASGVCRQPGGAAYPVSPMTSIVPTIPGSAGFSAIHWEPGRRNETVADNSPPRSSAGATRHYYILVTRLTANKLDLCEL